MLPEAVRSHLANVADNLQLLADLGYGHVALAVAGEDGVLTVLQEARPSTAVTPHAASRAHAACTIGSSASGLACSAYTSSVAK